MYHVPPRSTNGVPPCCFCGALDVSVYMVDCGLEENLPGKGAAKVARCAVHWLRPYMYLRGRTMLTNSDDKLSQVTVFELLRQASVFELLQRVVVRKRGLGGAIQYICIHGMWV